MARIVIVVDSETGVMDVAAFNRGFEAARECRQMSALLDAEIEALHRATLERCHSADSTVERKSVLVT